MLTWIWGTSGVSQGSQSSSRIGACTCDFLSGCSSSVPLPLAWIKGAVAFPRGFPTGMSHVSQLCESILGLNVEAVQENRFPWNFQRVLHTLAATQEVPRHTRLHSIGSA